MESRALRSIRILSFFEEDLESLTILWDNKDRSIIETLNIAWDLFKMNIFIEGCTMKHTNTDISHRHCLLIGSVGFILGLVTFLPVRAGTVTTDGTTGAATSLTGPNYTISQSLGTTAGNNLFHSFGTFNLNHGDIATFTGANTLQNVISRVTDGSASSIDGTIQSKIRNANFFFINPAGVIFGEHSAIDVPAAFHVGTAQELRFTDNVRFSAIMPKGSSFTSAAPEAFGFLKPSGAIQMNKSQLTFKEGTAVNVAGGSVTSDGATLKVPRGSLRVYGQGDTVGAVPISGDLPAGNGAVTINGGGLLGHDNVINNVGSLDTSGNGAGNLWISGDAVTIINAATLYNHNTGQKDAEGKIRIDANSLLMDNTSIKSRAYLSGKAGYTVVNVNGDMWVKNNAVVSSSAYPGSTDGKAGDVVVNVGGEMQVMNGGGIASDTFAQGNAGTVTVTAGSLIIDSQGFTEWMTGVSSSASSTGKAGGVVVNVSGEMQVLNGGEVSSGTFAQGNAGTATVTAGSLIIDSKGFTEGLTGISSSANPDSTGKAGNVVVNVSGEMQVLNGGEVSSGTFAQGDAGTVTVTAGSLITDSKGFTEVLTGISSLANSGSTGKAGDVVVNVSGEMQVLNGGEVSSSTFAQGDAGTVTVMAGNLIIDSKGFTEGLTGISSSANTDSMGKAGAVNVKVIERAQMLGDPQNLNSAISSANWGIGDAGTVNVAVGGRLSIIGTAIETSAKNGNGGSINVNVSLLDLTNSKITTSVETGGNGGDITVRGNYLVMDTGFIQANTAAKGAAGGNIFIDEFGIIGKGGLMSVGKRSRETFVANSGRNIIQAAAPDGVSGDVTLTSPDTSTAAGMVAVSDRRLEMRPIINPCTGRKHRISLRLKGRGRLPLKDFAQGLDKLKSSENYKP